MSGRHFRTASAVALVLSGCTVGPNYTQAPPVATSADYKEASDKEKGAWRHAHPEDAVARGKWWEVFGDADLNALEEQVTVANQSLKVAEANFRQARALIGIQQAAQYPTLSVNPSAQSLKDSGHTPYFSNTHPTPTGEFQLPLDLSYELDLWGRVARSITAAGEEAQATAADLETASLSLHAELAIDYFDLRSADSLEQLLNDSVKAYADALRLTENRAEGGAAPESDVAQAKTLLDTTRVQATDVLVQRTQFEHAIAVLIGKPPGSFSLPVAPLVLHQPAIPVGIPSELLQRRPDIAAAERRVAEANEQIGIARAAYYPSLSLSGIGGLEGTTITNWLNWPSLFWAVGLSMGETLFDGGRRNATSKAALAAYDATVANYRQTTLGAFQEVEDNLAALRILEQEAHQQAEAIASAKRSLELSTNRYVGGVDTYLQVIVAETAALANELNETSILRRRMEASVLLIKAVGGGWDTADLPKLDDLRKADDHDSAP
jgi:NodT family efflux transporter outer membrane factor (OMF) lipoprotein